MQHGHGMQHGYDMQHGHAELTWACSMDIQHNMQQDMKHRHAAGHEAWTSC